MQYEFVDRRTIRFKMPESLLPAYGKSCTLPIIIVQNDTVIGKFYFAYLAPSISQKPPVTSECSCVLTNGFFQEQHTSDYSDEPFKNFDDFFSVNDLDWL